MFRNFLRSFNFNKTTVCRECLSTSQASFLHQKIRPRRAILYVPGDDERKLKKVTELQVDCVAFDCEDGVAVNRKDVARETIANFLSKEQLDESTDWSVRVNSFSSGLLAEDLKVICNSHRPPKTILLPKVESFEDLNYFTSNLKQSAKNKNEKINLIFYAESCRSVMDLPDICRHAISLSESSPFQLAGIVFGSDDFCASLGATRTELSMEIIYARQRIVLIAKAFGLQAIDMVFIDFKNDAGLVKQSSEGASMGYTGKQVIHPCQIDIVQKAFLPSQKEIQWAIGLLKSYEEHQKLGKGAFVYNNQMIDAPTMKQAENIINLVNNTKSK